MRRRTSSGSHGVRALLGWAAGGSWFPRVFLAVAVLAVLIATLTPMGGEKPRVTLCLVCGERWASDVLLNLILYAPVGIALALCGWRGPRAVIIPAILAASIEVAQIWIPGRAPSLGDVTFNTLGAALGVMLVRSSSVWLRQEGRFKPALAVCAAATAVAALAATGMLLRPDFPRSAYWGQWTPDLGNMARYRGLVLSARLGPRSLSQGRLDGSHQVRDLLLARAPLEVRRKKSRAATLSAVRARAQRLLHSAAQCAAGISLAAVRAQRRSGAGNLSQRARGQRSSGPAVSIRLDRADRR